MDKDYGVIGKGNIVNVCFTDNQGFGLCKN